MLSVITARQRRREPDGTPRDGVFPTLSNVSGLAVAALYFGILCGCSEAYPKAVVTGKIMCGDKPAWGGVVTFQPIDAPDKTGNPAGNPGGVSRGLVQEDGSFRLTYEVRGGDREQDGAVIGPHRVTFILPMTQKRQFSKQDEWIPGEDQVRMKEQMANEPIYPKLECGTEITPGEVEVKAGSNEFTFTLKSGAPAPVQVRPVGSD